MSIEIGMVPVGFPTNLLAQVADLSRNQKPSLRRTPHAMTNRTNRANTTPDFRTENSEMRALKPNEAVTPDPATLRSPARQPHSPTVRREQIRSVRKLRKNDLGDLMHRRIWASSAQMSLLTAGDPTALFLSVHKVFIQTARREKVGFSRLEKKNTI